MKTIRMNLHPIPFGLIKEGSKTVELRLWDEKRKQLQIGDRIEFWSGDENILVEIVGFVLSDTIANLFTIISPKDCGFKSAAEGIEITE